MAALYLHHALFTPEPPPLPERNPNSDIEPPPGLPATILRDMASISTVALLASDSFKSSHNSDPLLNPVSQEATTAFLDIPIISPRHPDHPSSPGTGWLNGPRSERVLSGQSNRGWPLDTIWRRLRRLKSFYALSYTLIGARLLIHLTLQTVHLIICSGLGELQHRSILPVISRLLLSTEANNLSLSGNLYHSLCRRSPLLSSLGRPESLRAREPVERNRIHTRCPLALFGITSPPRASNRQSRARDHLEDVQRSTDHPTWPMSLGYRRRLVRCRACL